ncbi:MAG: TrkH family potassium uptake protein [Roseovarius sp.]|nr:TrkH family potassium uptake protein [Roseovarius sp.]MCY4206514.1 TrkH family potassium uptake protein [Roseovarius sp.]MCY4316576.1 TrkH family potassium uptake protein [Roseovarius sp.]
MTDMRPVGYIISFMVMFLGIAMLIPMVLEIASQTGHWPVFGKSAMLTILIGGLVAVASKNGVPDALNIKQTFLITTGIWFVLPLFGAIPFLFSELELSVVDAVFEAMSGLTTTGSTVLSGLQDMPRGILLWRGLLQWIGGIGIIIVAMVFLTELRVGGMQIFRSNGLVSFDMTLPAATRISTQISVIYVILTILCLIGYMVTGMGGFDAVVHSMTTVATGGFGNYDNSFAGFNHSTEYVAVLFMLLAALPFILFIHLADNNVMHLLNNPQVRGLLATAATLAAAISFWRFAQADEISEAAFRKALFNTVSILTGTGYASDDYMQWGSFPVTALFFVGLIGGCAGSTSCSIKIFRYQLLFASIRVQLRKISNPNGVSVPRYNGQSVEDDVLYSVISFFVFFIVTLGVTSVLLGLAGEDFITSVSGASAALANIGPGLGDVIGPTGNFSSIDDMSKWVLTAAMLIGRLELLAVYAIFTIAFWRA